VSFSGTVNWARFQVRTSGGTNDLIIDECRLVKSGTGSRQGSAAIDERTAKSDAERNGISIYPNPSNGTYTLELADERRVVINELSGKRVFEQKMPAGKQLLDLSHLSKGLYLLRINGAKTEKLIIQ